MDKLSVKNLDITNKKVIMRVDFNVPMDDDLNITDDIRIQGAIATIRYVLEQQPAKLILMSHLGRPKGKVNEKLSLKPASIRLQELIGEDVLMLADCIGDSIAKKIAESKERVVLLENLRFHKEETENDVDFSKKLAELADLYINDAFGSAHRAHASTEGITNFLPAAAGFLLQKEIEYLGKAIEDPDRPLVVILGGAKVSDKILLIESLIAKADVIIIGGGMAFTFLKSMGKEIGKSICEDEKLDLAKNLIKKAEDANVKLMITSDYLVVEGFDKPESKKYVTEIPSNTEAVDIGPETIDEIKKVLASARTVIWNGPLGVFEIDDFAKGTEEIAKYLASLKEVTTIIGGGDSAAAVAKFGLADQMTHISTGGGASLEYLEGKELPGIAALTNSGEYKKVSA